jgi:hypothetical protein
MFALELLVLFSFSLLTAQWVIYQGFGVEKGLHHRLFETIFKGINRHSYLSLFSRPHQPRQRLWSTTALPKKRSKKEETRDSPPKQERRKSAECVALYLCLLKTEHLNDSEEEEEEEVISEWKITEEDNV